jgi:hypothetical protein
MTSAYYCCPILTKIEGVDKVQYNCPLQNLIKITESTAW